jgi:glycosyltransferase involved in cell wall biosynthesis
LSVVVPTRDRSGLLGRTLDCLDRQDGGARPFEVIVADDGSRDGTDRLLAQRAAAHSFPLRRVRLTGRGPATARNAGIAAARAERVLLLGDDTLPRPDTLANHLNAAGDRDVGVQGRIEWHPEEEITPVMEFLAPAGPQYYFVRLRSGGAIPYTALLGANLSAPTRWFREEPFDEKFPAAVFEDTEMGYRWKRRGWRTIYSSAAVCWHSHPYREIETFLARQRRAGRAARYAVGKHPGMFLRTILQPCVVGILHEGRYGVARAKGVSRPEYSWDRRVRLEFLRGWLERNEPQ